MLVQKGNDLYLEKDGKLFELHSGKPYKKDNVVDELVVKEKKKVVKEKSIFGKKKDKK